MHTYDYKDATPELLDEVMRLCAGKVGVSEAETVIHFTKDGEPTYSTGIGAHAAQVLRRNRQAVRKVSLWKGSGGELQVSFQLDAARVRDPWTIVKPYRTEEQIQATNERMRAMREKAQGAGGEA